MLNEPSLQLDLRYGDAGSQLFAGNEVWVRSELERAKIEIIREHKW